MDSTRIDRWLWAVRIYKTRSDATRACSGGHVEIGGRPAKPAHRVKVGDRVIARVGERERIVDVARVIDKRVGAPVAVECYVDHSPPPPERPLQALFGERERGAGRPTKRDRRQLDRYLDRGR
ncbi:MAG TPA: RNA-binding S4 domain-containing protein [Acidimicrobiales bacterium]|nr:RNA-binding S4 domain-containing protein [Acidimicrobiales bacterium]